MGLADQCTPRGGSVRKSAVCAIAAFTLVLAVHAVMQRPTALLDDGGITLRYAERIASGQGFHYVDTGAVNGASNPLYTFLIAGLLHLGVPAWGAVKGLGVVAMALTSGVLAWTFTRWYSAAAALFAVAALATNGFLSAQMVSGLETPLTLLLAACFFLALHRERPAAIGVSLRLLVANKADGGLAALAFAAVSKAATGRFPIRVAIIALLVALPVAAVILASFGTLVPGAALTKLTVHGGARFDAWWAIEGLRSHGGSAKLLELALISSVLLFLRPCRSLPFRALLLWFAGLMVALSTINLGDPYPWYLAPPLLLTILLAAILVHHVASIALRLMGQTDRPWLATLAIALASGAAFWPSTSRLLQRRPIGMALHEFPLADLARQTAGAWLRQHTSGTEVFDTPFGLPAFEYGGPVYDSALLNNERDPARQGGAAYSILEVPRGLPPEISEGRSLVAFFRITPGALGYALYAAPSSELMASTARFLPGVTAPVDLALDPFDLKGAFPEGTARLRWTMAQLRAGEVPAWAAVR